MIMEPSIPQTAEWRTEMVCLKAELDAVEQARLAGAPEYTIEESRELLEKEVFGIASK